MKIENIGKRGVYFTYEDGDAPIAGNTSIYLINTEKRIFLCDTHMGATSMEIVKKHISDSGWDNKELIIFNSHSDWDHIWGNCAFKGVTIIAHEKSRARIKERGEYDLRRLGKYCNGHVELVMPNLTFESVIRFEDEEIEFIYAPGHTEDSSICFDRKESVMFAGDLLEYPLPVINHHNIQAYIRTIEVIRDYSANTLLSSHSGIIGTELLNKNLEYLRGFLGMEALDITTQKDEEWRLQHDYNVKNRMIQWYIDIVKEKQGDRFDYKSFKKEFWSLVNTEYINMGLEYSYILNSDYRKLEDTLIGYVSKL